MFQNARVATANLPEELADFSISPPMATGPWSKVYRGECARFGSAVAVKMFIDPLNGRPAANDAQNYFDMLTEISDAGASDPLFAVPKPLLMVHDMATVVSEWVTGVTLRRKLATASTRQVRDAVRDAGRWLGCLHRSFGVTYRRLDTEQMLEKLFELDGAQSARASNRIRRAIARLRESAPGVGDDEIPWSRLHGDFKPQNLIYSEGRVFGIDIGEPHRNAGVRDAAHFLNHLHLLLLSPAGLRHLPFRERLVEAFHEGYQSRGGVLPRRHLEWCQMHAAIRMRLNVGQWSSPPKAWVAALQINGLLESLIRRLSP